MGTLLFVVLPACGLLGGGGEDVEPTPARQTVGAEPGGGGGDGSGSGGGGTTADDLFDQLQAEKIKSQNLQGDLNIANAELEAYRATGVVVEGVSRPEISLERARLEVIKYAKVNTDIYGPTLANRPMVWEVVSAEEGEEFYYINLAFRPAGVFVGTPGDERFVVERTFTASSEPADRQVFSPPVEGGPVPTPTPVATATPTP
ncbi:MAG: hypothetical protein O2854_07270 [Chloroflexi bacterium]|nr:hypothetical protein [Chloroflexota bacterium]